MSAIAVTDQVAEVSPRVKARIAGGRVLASAVGLSDVDAITHTVISVMAKKTRRSAKTSATKRPGAKRSRRKSSRSSAPRHEPTRGLYGWITHTELASADPIATKDWCVKVLGWTFKPSMPMPGGEYHLFAYSDKGGGGIRATKPFETPGSTFTVHVADCQASFEKAVREGAERMMPPTRIMEGVTIAMVRAPGGVLVGLSGP